jgi:hypothetical protein
MISDLHRSLSRIFRLLLEEVILTGLRHTEKRARSEGVAGDDGPDMCGSERHPRAKREGVGGDGENFCDGEPSDPPAQCDNDDGPSDLRAAAHHGLAGPAPAGGRAPGSGCSEDQGRGGSGRRVDSHGPAAAGTPGDGPLVDGEAPSNHACR